MGMERTRDERSFLHRSEIIDSSSKRSRSADLFETDNSHEIAFMTILLAQAGASPAAVEKFKTILLLLFQKIIQYELMRTRY